MTERDWLELKRIVHARKERRRAHRETLSALINEVERLRALLAAR